MDNEYWHNRYSKLYWEHNELQLIKPDTRGERSRPSAIDHMIEQLEQDMQEAEKKLGYTPAP